MIRRMGEGEMLQTFTRDKGKRPATWLGSKQCLRALNARKDKYHVLQLGLIVGIYWKLLNKGHQARTTLDIEWLRIRTKYTSMPTIRTGV